MRTSQGRRDWRAGSRVDGLLRYAFLGDSNAYGTGVAPDQTLAAVFEKQANESLPGWPIEAVNYGISGYNLWNSWLAFKQAPQVFDGIVLTLCTNDADLFGRTQRIQYSQPFESRWESAHPLGAAVARCFDEMAAFAQQRDLPVALVFSKLTHHDQRITEIVAGLCATRGFCFVDTYTHYRARNFALADLLASRADGHPSAQAHDAIGRYLLATLKRAGWFGKYSGGQIEAAPDRVVAAVRAMVQIDGYPADVALSWGLRTLQAKALYAQRVQAAAGSGGDCNPTFDRCRQTLATSDSHWHRAHRIRAFVGAIASGHYDLCWFLYCSENERLRLEEICFALLTNDWERLSTHSLGQASQRKPVTPGEVPRSPAFFDPIHQDIQSIYRELSNLRSAAVDRPAIPSDHDEALMLADLALLENLTGRMQLEYDAVRSVFVRIQEALETTSPFLSEAHKADLAGMIGSACTQIKWALGNLRRWPALLRGFSDPQTAPFTTVEVTVCASPIEGKPPNCLLTLQAEYAVPFRLAFTDIGAFWPDGSQFRLKLHVPLLYAGRVLLTAWNPKAISTTVAGFEILKVELYNREDQRRVIHPSSFWKDTRCRFVSPVAYLV